MQTSHSTAPVLMRALPTFTPTLTISQAEARRMAVWQWLEAWRLTAAAAGYEPGCRLSAPAQAAIDRTAQKAWQAYRRAGGRSHRRFAVLVRLWESSQWEATSITGAP